MLGKLLVVLLSLLLGSNAVATETPSSPQDNNSYNSEGDSNIARYITRYLDPTPTLYPFHEDRKCISVPGRLTEDTTLLTQWTCHGKDNQRWIIQQTDDGYVTLQAEHSGKCIDVTSGSTTDGTPLVQYTCHGGDNQRWMIQSIGGDGVITLQSKSSGKCIDILGDSPTDGAPLIQWTCHGGDSQKFRLQ